MHPGPTTPSDDTPADDVPEIRTERLLLRGWRDTDLEALARLCADTAVMEHFPAPMTTSESQVFLDSMRDRWDEAGLCFWAVEVPGVAPCIGLAGLQVPGFDADFMPTVEIGWRLAREHWGRGYAPEAASAALAFGFGELDLDEVVSFTTPDNANSRRVMEKIGMLHDPSGDFDHPSLEPGHRLERHVLYRITADRWAGLRG